MHLFMRFLVLLLLLPLWAAAQPTVGQKFTDSLPTEAGYQIPLPKGGWEVIAVKVDETLVPSTRHVLLKSTESPPATLYVVARYSRTSNARVNPNVFRQPLLLAADRDFCILETLGKTEISLNRFDSSRSSVVQKCQVSWALDSSDRLVKFATEDFLWSGFRERIDLAGDLAAGRVPLLTRTVASREIRQAESFFVNWAILDVIHHATNSRFSTTKSDIGSPSRKPIELSPEMSKWSADYMQALTSSVIDRKFVAVPALPTSVLDAGGGNTVAATSADRAKPVSQLPPATGGSTSDSMQRQKEAVQLAEAQQHQARLEDEARRREQQEREALAERARQEQAERERSQAEAQRQRQQAELQQRLKAEEDARRKEQQERERLAAEARQQKASLEQRLNAEAEARKKEQQAREASEQKARQEQLERERLAAEVERLRAELVKAQQTANPASVAYRKAFVVGIDNYRHITKLSTAREDARAMASALSAAGFSVSLHLDVGEKDLRAAWRKFADQVEGGSEVAFFFAGHGVQLGGLNYLIPADVAGESERQLQDDSIPLQRILDDMTDRKAKLTLAVIDACRDNPFRVAGRNVGNALRGLAPTTPATGQMVIFSAGAGQRALDNLGPTDKARNGVFTRVFVEEMKQRGVSIDKMARNTRSEVVRLARSIGHDQVPAVYDQTIGEFFLLK